jgi:hypothetical protein
MLGSGKTGRVRASAAASSARSRDIYQRYAVALYRQALLAPGAGRGEDDARYHLARSVFRRCHRLVAGSAQQDRRPGLFGGPGSIRASRVLGTLSVTWRPSCAVLRRLTTSPAATVEDGDQAGGTAAGRR